MAQMQVFVSHSHDDDTFCRGIVGALRGAGADVWYDEHNLGSGQLIDTIERELKARPVFVVILSVAALRSQWVRDECKWAYNLLRRDPSRIILPVTAGPLEEDAIWMFLGDFKRIEAPGLRPYPIEEACGRLLHALALTAPGEAPITPTPQPQESVDELLAQGKALVARKKYAEAIPFLERATQLDPRSFGAWGNLGLAYNATGRYADALTACDRALVLDSNRPWVWHNKGKALNDLKHPQEAAAAYDAALALDSSYGHAWHHRGSHPDYLDWIEDALAAYDRALTFDPNFVFAWNAKGNALNMLKRYDEALAAFDQALALDPNSVFAWNGKGIALYCLALFGRARYDEALAAYDRALALDPRFVVALKNKAIMLRRAGRTSEAEAAERRAAELERQQQQ